MKAFVYFKSYLIFSLLIAVGNPLLARVGESKSGFESRLLSKTAGALKYPSREDNLREAQELPYKMMFFIMPRNVEHGFYFKRADAQSASDSDVIAQHELYGWELHTIFLNNISAFEFYRRHGDPMTLEELKLLMESMAGKSHWVRSNFVPVSRRWDLCFRNGEARSFLLGKDGKIMSNDSKQVGLKAILPENPTRFIYVEVPEDVKKASKYNLSITAQLMDIEQSKRYDAYRKYIEKNNALLASKSAKKGKRTAMAPQQVIYPFRGKWQKSMSSFICDIGASVKNGNESSLYNFAIDDVLVGGRPIVRNDKTVILTMTIPLQPDTAFGYNYELANGALRAKLYENGILFIDAKFDKQMRAYMEKLYAEQEETRKAEAKTSVSKF